MTGVSVIATETFTSLQGVAALARCYLLFRGFLYKQILIAPGKAW